MFTNKPQTTHISNPPSDKKNLTNIVHLNNLYCFTSLGDDVSRKSEKDEVDGGHHQGYERMSNSDEKIPKKSKSDEKIPKKTKSERGLLKRLASGKGKHSDYNSLQMEIETPRPIGS